MMAATESIEPTAPVTEPSKPKPPRKRHVQIDVPAYQADWPEEAQAKCYYQRLELKALQAALVRQQKHIRNLRHQCRLYQRVMRLRHESKLDGITQAIDRQRRIEDERLIEHIEKALDEDRKTEQAQTEGRAQQEA